MTPTELTEIREVLNSDCQESDLICSIQEAGKRALAFLDEQAAEIKQKGLECAGCGKRYEDVRGKSRKDGDLLLGEIRLDPGSPANRVEPEISYEIYFWCAECMEEGEQLRAEGAIR